MKGKETWSTTHTHFESWCPGKWTDREQNKEQKSRSPTEGVWSDALLRSPVHYILAADTDTGAGTCEVLNVFNVIYVTFKQRSALSIWETGERYCLFTRHHLSSQPMWWWPWYHIQNHQQSNMWYLTSLIVIQLVSTLLIGYWYWLNTIYCGNINCMKSERS